MILIRGREKCIEAIERKPIYVCNAFFQKSLLFNPGFIHSQKNHAFRAVRYLDHFPPLWHW